MSFLEAGEIPRSFRVSISLGFKSVSLSNEFLFPTRDSICSSFLAVSASICFCLSSFVFKLMPFSLNRFSFASVFTLVPKLESSVLPLSSPLFMTWLASLTNSLVAFSNSCKFFSCSFVICSNICLSRSFSFSSRESTNFSPPSSRALVKPCIIEIEILLETGLIDLVETAAEIFPNWFSRLSSFSPAIPCLESRVGFWDLD